MEEQNAAADGSSALKADGMPESERKSSWWWVEGFVLRVAAVFGVLLLFSAGLAIVEWFSAKYEPFSQGDIASLEVEDLLVDPPRHVTVSDPTILLRLDAFLLDGHRVYSTRQAEPHTHKLVIVRRTGERDVRDLCGERLAIANWEDSPQYLFESNRPGLRSFIEALFVKEKK